MLIGGLEQKMALIHFYFKVDIEQLILTKQSGFDEFARLWGELEFALEFEGKLKTQKIIQG